MSASEVQSKLVTIYNHSVYHFSIIMIWGVPTETLSVATTIAGVSD